MKGNFHVRFLGGLAADNRGRAIRYVNNHAYLRNADHMEFRQLIRNRTLQRILFLPHAMRQMSRPDRMISTADVRKVLEEGEIIEDYPEDARGHSCLILGWGKEGWPIHIVCAPKDEYVAIITAYIPDKAQWSTDFRTRVKS